MAANRYLANTNGYITMVVPATTGGGGSANQIPALNASGLLDITMMPIGVIADAVSVTASENLAAGAIVSFWNNSGINVRNADNTNATKPGQGFTIASVSSSGTATIYSLGQLNTGVSALTVGSVYFLGTVGAITTTPPSSAGNLVQEVGVAVATAELSTYSKSTITVA